MLRNLTLISPAIAAILAMAAPGSARVRDPVTVNPLGKVAPGVQPGDSLGRAVAVSGEWAVLGHPERSHLQWTQSGTAWVYRWDGSAWILFAGLESPAPQNLWGYGRAVAIDGNTLAVAEGYPVGVEKVFVYRFDGLWSLEQVLQPATSEDAFGQSLALQGDTLLVGAFSGDAAGQDAGAAFVYERVGSTWTLQQELHPTGLAAGDRMGSAVAIDGGRLALGAPQSACCPFNGPGKAYVYRRDGATWVEEALLVPAGAVAGDRFGSALVLADGDLIGGAPGGAAGAANVFRRDGLAWAEVAQLTPSDGSTFDRFGTSLSMDEETLLVGAPLHDAAGRNAGSAYVFRRIGAEWREVERFVGFDTAPDDAFGSGLYLDGGHLLVGAPGNAGDKGAVYLFEYTPLAFTYCTAKTNSCGGLPAITFTGTPTAGANSGFTVAASGAKAGKFGLLLYTTAGPASTPFQGGFLCLATPPIKRTIAVADSTGTPGACDGTLAIDMSAFAVGALGGNPLPALSVPGTQINCQWWARDTLAQVSLLTDALQYVVCP